MNDATFTQFMSDLWGGDPNADLWEIALLDDDPVFSDPDPAREAACLRDVEANGGDLLMSPPGFEEPLPPGRDYQPGPWPIDPDEEVTW